MFINGDGNWVNILNDAVITFNNNIQSTIYMAPVDASNNPDKVRYIISTSTKIEPKGKPGSPNLKLVIMLEMQIKVISFIKVTFLIGIENFLKLMKFSTHNH